MKELTEALPADINGITVIAKYPEKRHNHVVYEVLCVECGNVTLKRPENIKAGKMKALGISSDKRIAGVDIPTFKEQGVDVSIANWRGVFAPPGVTDAQRKAMIDLIEATVKSAAWKDILEKQDWANVLLTGDAILDGARAASMATIDAGCPSASNAVASGCATGAATLASDAPWVGQTLRLEATGLPLAAFAIAVGSTQSANLPLAGVFATAIPGCTLLVQPDVTSTQLAVAGKAQLAFAIPNTPALAGAAFREQFVHFALDPSLAVGATHALDLVVGSYGAFGGAP
jgi:hypothetical protein